MGSVEKNYAVSENNQFTQVANKESSAKEKVRGKRSGGRFSTIKKCHIISAFIFGFAFGAGLGFASGGGITFFSGGIALPVLPLLVGAGGLLFGTAAVISYLFFCAVLKKTPKNEVILKIPQSVINENIKELHSDKDLRIIDVKTEMPKQWQSDVKGWDVNINGKHFNGENRLEAIKNALEITYGKDAFPLIAIYMNQAINAGLMKYIQEDGNNYSKHFKEQGPISIRQVQGICMSCTVSTSSKGEPIITTTSFLDFGKMGSPPKHLHYISYTQSFTLSKEYLDSGGKVDPSKLSHYVTGKDTLKVFNYSSPQDLIDYEGAIENGNGIDD